MGNDNTGAIHSQAGKAQPIQSICQNQRPTAIPTKYVNARTSKIIRYSVFTCGLIRPKKLMLTGNSTTSSAHCQLLQIETLEREFLINFELWYNKHSDRRPKDYVPISVGR